MVGWISAPLSPTGTTTKKRVYTSPGGSTYSSLKKTWKRIRTGPSLPLDDDDIGAPVLVNPSPPPPVLEPLVNLPPVKSSLIKPPPASLPKPAGLINIKVPSATILPESLGSGTASETCDDLEMLVTFSQIDSLFPSDIGLKDIGKKADRPAKATYMTPSLIAPPPAPLTSLLVPPAPSMRLSSNLNLSSNMSLSSARKGKHFANSDAASTYLAAKDQKQHVMSSESGDLSSDDTIGALLDAAFPGVVEEVSSDSNKNCQDAKAGLCNKNAKSDLNNKTMKGGAPKVSVSDEIAEKTMVPASVPVESVDRRVIDAARAYVNSLSASQRDVLILRTVLKHLSRAFTSDAIAANMLKIKHEMYKLLMNMASAEIKVEKSAGRGSHGRTVGSTAPSDFHPASKSVSKSLSMNSVGSTRKCMHNNRCVPVCFLSTVSSKSFIIRLNFYIYF